ncbi:MAG TPA: hypothetical protein VMG58_15110 [Candidatus Sulfotelmatobacter sp.]|nr:hypothetical protein [Candidatus Sulfotelmatobacter sp.]
MIPTSYAYDPVWSIVTGLLLAAVLGLSGVGLLLWAFWQWLVRRARALPAGGSDGG